ncbi:ATP/GTP-binding protein [Elizabethkingia anophelis]|uniref:AAA family ATPase n=1 Tax=Elizabethkingia anophelis TaxID=1117645 RepID=UPI003786FDE8
MIIDFVFKNFRSFKDESTFTLKADSFKSKQDNTFEIETVNGPVKLLKTAVIYGPNAGGKSNFIKALETFVLLIRYSPSFNSHENRIISYDPFELDINSQNSPVYFKISFFLEDYVRYDYEVSILKQRIASERLDFYPKGQVANIFERVIKNDDEVDLIELGKNLKGKRIPKKVFNNQLYLSKFGWEVPHDVLTPIYKYLSNIDVWMSHDKYRIDLVNKEISMIIAQSESVKLKERLSKLIRISDTKIEGISSKELKRNEFHLPKEIPEEIVDEIYEDNKIRTYSHHKIFDGTKEVDVKEFDFNQKESTGTKVLFALGGKILQKLESGGIFVVDELDNSLHPKLCKFLIRLFNNKVSNPKNAQLIFATHEVTLLDKDVFRKDQIWFVEKNKYGSSEMYCANEFEGVRDETNFEVWYRTGKFGGDPNIKEIEFIYE